METADTFRGCFGGGTPRWDVRYTSQEQHSRVFSTTLEIKTVSTFAHWSTACHARAVLATKSVALAVSSRRTFLEGVLRNYVTSADVRMSFCESGPSQSSLAILYNTTKRGAYQLMRRRRREMALRLGILFLTCHYHQLSPHTCPCFLSSSRKPREDG